LLVLLDFRGNVAREYCVFSSLPFSGDLEETAFGFCGASFTKGVGFCRLSTGGHCIRFFSPIKNNLRPYKRTKKVVQKGSFNIDSICT